MLMAFEHIAAGEGHEDQVVVVWGMVADLAAPVEVDTEAEVGKALGHVMVVVLDGTHLMPPHRLADSHLVSYNLRHVLVEGGAAVACCQVRLKRRKSWFAYGLGSCAKGELWRSSLFASGLAEELRQRYWRKRPPFGSSRNVQIHLDEAHSIDLIDSLPCRPPTMI